MTPHALRVCFSASDGYIDRSYSICSNLDRRISESSQCHGDTRAGKSLLITKAERAGQPPHIIEAAVGRKRSGMSLGRYSGGPGVKEQMRACVEAVRLPATMP